MHVGSSSVHQEVEQQVATWAPNVSTLTVTHSGFTCVRHSIWRYAGCNRQVHTHSGNESHIPKHEQMSIWTMCPKTFKLKVMSEKAPRDRTLVFCSGSTAHFFVSSLLFDTARSETTSTIFTTHTRGRRRSVMYSVLDTSADLWAGTVSDCFLGLHRLLYDVLNSTHYARWTGRGGSLTWLVPVRPVLTKKRHLTALWMPVRLFQITLESLKDCSDLSDVCRFVHWILWRTFWVSK
jgi:hypothetical protein